MIVSVSLFVIEPISYGITNSQFIAKESGFLSYSASSKVVVLAKIVQIYESELEIWKVEVCNYFVQIRDSTVESIHFVHSLDQTKKRIY